MLHKKLSNSAVSSFCQIFDGSLAEGYEKEGHLFFGLTNEPLNSVLEIRNSGSFFIFLGANSASAGTQNFRRKLIGIQKITE